MNTEELLNKRPVNLLDLLEWQPTKVKTVQQTLTRFILKSHIIRWGVEAEKIRLDMVKCQQTK